MSFVGGLSHLKEDDKKEILSEIKFFMSQKGFIDGIALYERFESVLGTKGELSVEEIRQFRENRRRR